MVMNGYSVGIGNLLAYRAGLIWRHNDKPCDWQMTLTHIKYNSKYNNTRANTHTHTRGENVFSTVSAFSLFLAQFRDELSKGLYYLSLSLLVCVRDQ